jgi:hypothetical protein
MEKLTVISLIVLAILLTSIVWYASTNTPKSTPTSTPTPTASAQPDISAVQVVSYQPNWQLASVGSGLGGPFWFVNPYLDITIKNPTQYTVYIELYGTSDITITSQGNVKNDYSCNGGQAFTLPPYSENNNYKINMEASLNYRTTPSDNLTVTFNNYNVSELYRGTVLPPI